MRGRNWKTSLLFALSLAFALLGQLYFFYRREYVWDGTLFWALALGAAILLVRRLRRLERGPALRRPFAWAREHPLRVLLAVSGLWLSFLAGGLARQWPETAGFGDLLWLWLAGVALFLLPFILPVLTNLQTCKLAGLRRCKLASVQTWALVALFVVALIVRAYDLAHIPANLGGDEGTQGVAALELVAPPLGNPFATGWFSVPTMSFLAYGLAMRVFGATVTGLRMLSALIGAGTVLTTFLLARALWEERVAWLAAVVVTFSHYHIHFSRLGSNQIADGLLMTLTLWLLVRGLRSRRAFYFALAGATTGLGWYGYFGARLILIVIGAYLGWRMVAEHRFLERYGRQLLILAAGLLVVVAPLMLHYAAHPETMTARFDQVSIFASGWLARERELTGRSAASLLLQQVWKSISAFNYTLDPTFWYRARIPLLDVISGLFFVWGLIWVTARWRWPSNALLLLWFWLALILGWVLTENPPSSMRMTGIVPALAILVALGLDWLRGTAARIFPLSPITARFTIYALLLASVVFNVYYYFVVYTPTRVYGNPTAEVATELGRHLARRDERCFVYLHGAPEIYWQFGALQFLARGFEGEDVLTSTEGELPAFKEEEACFVFLPHRLAELEAVRATYPDGAETRVHSSADDRLLYVLYER
jgi:hypothetical protein